MGRGDVKLSVLEKLAVKEEQEDSGAGDPMDTDEHVADIKQEDVVKQGKQKRCNYLSILQLDPEAATGLRTPLRHSPDMIPPGSHDLSEVSCDMLPLT